MTSLVNLRVKAVCNYCGKRKACRPNLKELLFKKNKKGDLMPFFNTICTKCYAKAKGVPLEWDKLELEQQLALKQKWVREVEEK